MGETKYVALKMSRKRGNLKTGGNFVIKYHGLGILQQNVERVKEWAKSHEGH